MGDVTDGFDFEQSFDFDTDVVPRDSRNTQWKSSIDTSRYGFMGEKEYEGSSEGSA